MRVDLLVLHARQLLTIASPDGPRRGPAVGELGLIEDGGLAVRGEEIVAVGPSHLIQATYRAPIVIDATGCVVMPGFVDPHTHALFAGDRASEFEERLQGKTYLEILRAGGGILHTVRTTRAASWERLIAETWSRLDQMLEHGTTTAEVKTGYALDTGGELRLLRALLHLDAHHPLDVIPTFLPAHAVPPEYSGDAQGYVAHVIAEMLPAAAAFWQEQASPDRLAPLFCDVFCDQGAFDLAQTRHILEQARSLGMRLKVHADEFTTLGATALAVELGAVSVDHLVCTPQPELAALARSPTVGVSLPGTPFGLGQTHYTPARRFLEEGGILALASDLNPGTCYCVSMPFIIALACRMMRLTPAEAIVASTINAAYALGLGQRMGSLEVGKQADIVVLDLPDYRHLAYRFGANPVKLVIKRGQVVCSR